MRIWIVRHGVTDWNAEGRGQGQVDIELSATGLRQSNLLAAGWSDEPPARIVCSDMKRTVSTAQPLADRFGLGIEQNPALRERCLGEWEGRSIAEINAEIKGQCPLTFCPPGGETLMDVVGRVKELVADTPEVPTAYFSHGLTSGQLVAHFIGGDVTVGRGFRFDNTGVTTLEFWNGRWLVHRHNCTRHLEAAVATTA